MGVAERAPVASRPHDRPLVAEHPIAQGFARRRKRLDCGREAEADRIGDRLVAQIGSLDVVAQHPKVVKRIL
jgi:hypothetical protein